MFACIYAPGANASRILECASDFSPQVEETSPDTVVLNASGLRHLFGSAGELTQAIARRASELGLKANVAIAGDPDSAVHASRGFEGITVIPPGKEAAVLARLPLEILSVPLEMEETLRTWGIYTFGSLAALPEEGISERLGAEGVHFRRLARGEGTRPLVPAFPDPAYRETIELEYPVTLLEPLSFILGRLLNGVCAKLESHGYATHEIRLTLHLENKSEHIRMIRLPYPMCDGTLFLKLLKLDLETHPPKKPIVGVTLSAEPVNPRVFQTGLFIPLTPEPQKLELTLARIAKLVGEGNAGSPELLNTHRPDAFRMKRFVCEDRRPESRTPRHLKGSASESSGRRVRPHMKNGGTGYSAPKKLALRIFRPPLHAKVQAPAGRPTRVAARGIHGAVIDSAGPWRASGDWWRADAWSRDEWDVALSDGALYRIYLDRVSGTWFVQGNYD